MTEEDSKTACQQDSIPSIDATNPENQADSATKEAPKQEAPQIPDDGMEARCVIVFHLTEGKIYENAINLHPILIEQVRKGMIKSIEESNQNSIVSIQGSRNSPVDFCVIPVRNIIYFEFKVVEIVKKEKA